MAKARSGKDPSRRTAGSSQARRRTAGRTRRPTISRREKETLLNLETIVQNRIVGKEEAIARVANTIRIRRTNLDFHPRRPDGAFLLIGPPGVGKTEFAYAFAEALLGDDQETVHIDLADYTNEDDLADLVVAPGPGEDGALVEGTLTSPVRENPRAVILLRGLEHAHPTVHRLLLHILERGTISDAQGPVPFNQTTFFATTRLHPDAAETIEQIGFTREPLSREQRGRRMLEDQFSPELVGAFNELLYFDALTPDVVRQIARCKVNRVIERLRRQKRGVTVSEKVYDTFITEEEVHAAGAGHLNRALEEKLFTPLSKYLLTHTTARKIRVRMRGKRLVIEEQAPS